MSRYKCQSRCILQREQSLTCRTAAAASPCAGPGRCARPRCRSRARTCRAPSIPGTRARRSRTPPVEVSSHAVQAHDAVEFDRRDSKRRVAPINCIWHIRPGGVASAHCLTCTRADPKKFFSYMPRTQNIAPSKAETLRKMWRAHLKSERHGGLGVHSDGAQQVVLMVRTHIRPAVQHLSCGAMPV